MRRLCQHAGCPDPPAYRGRCRSHGRQRERATHQNRSVYNSKRWQMTRKRVLFEQPLCECGQIATDVDHVWPIEEGGAVWSRENLASMCHSCHAVKTRREQGVT